MNMRGHKDLGSNRSVHFKVTMSFVLPCHLNKTNTFLSFHIVAHTLAQCVLIVGESMLLKIDVYFRNFLDFYITLHGIATT